MTTTEFMNITGVSKKTAYLIHNLLHGKDYDKYRDFDERDVNYVLSRKLYNYTEGRIVELEDYPLRYVSDTGHVYTYVRGFLEEITGSIIYGYHYIDIANANGVKNFRVHRLVGKYFVPNPYNKPVINHKDGNKLNNHYTNLEWCTISENTKHAFDNNLAVNDKGFNDSQSIQVAYIDNNNLLHVFGSTRIAARITNKGITTISRQAKRNQIKIDNGECIFQIYNSFMYYYNFVKKCNEYQQNIFMPIFRDSNMDENEMLLVIR